MALSVEVARKALRFGYNLELGQGMAGSAGAGWMTRDDMSEEDRCLELARKGDREAQERLFEPLRPKLTAYFARRVRDVDEAENLAQQTIIQAYERMDSFRGECPFDRWVWSIAGNLAVKHYRSARGELSISEFTDREVPSVTPEQPRVHLDQWLSEILGEARSVCSQVELTVMLTFYQVGSFDRVADLLELNAGTVRSHFFRGRGLLLSHLICHSPDLVGGRKQIMFFAKKLLNGEGEERLEVAEYEALVAGSYRSRPYRSACLKIARLLPNPFEA